MGPGAGGRALGIVALAHLQNQRERNNPEGRLLGKLALIRRLYERGYERQAILDLFRFIDWVLELPEDLELRFRVELERREGLSIPGLKIGALPLSRSPFLVTYSDSQSS